MERAEKSMDKVITILNQILKGVVDVKSICTVAGAAGGYNLGAALTWVIGDRLSVIFPDRFADALYNIGQAIYPWLGMILGAILGYNLARKFTQAT